MPGESLNFPIFAPDRASGSFREVGRAALDASGKIDIAAASLKLWNDTTLKQGKAAASSEAAMRSHAKATALLADTENVLGGRATTTTKLIADQGQELEKSTQKASLAERAFSALGGGGGAGAGGGVSGMGALIGAGVVLSPMIATIGTGLLGLGAAAYGVAKPIENAAQKTGGLQANMAKLNPEQQHVAQGLLGLGQQFGAFEKQMQPAVFTIFNRGLSLAGTLLHGVEPVAMATGKALGQVLGQVGAEFRSGEWQNFFGFMARTASPDIHLLGQDFVGLMQILPPLLQVLQPVATTLVKIVGGGIQTLRVLEAAGEKIIHLHPQGQENIFQKIGDGLHWLENHAPQGHKSMGQLIEDALGMTHSMKDAGNTVAVAGPKFFSLNRAVAALNKSMTTLTGNLLNLQGGEVSWKQALQAAQAQLKSNTAGLSGNSKNALANKQAVIAATNAAISFASQQLTLGKNIGGASRTVQDQIKWLQGLHDKSQFVRQELAALRKEEQLLQAQKLDQTIHVQGLGQWSVSQSLAPGAGHRRAAGGLLTGPGTATSDSIPVWGSTGEYMVKAAAVSKYGVRLFDKLNAMNLAGGGLVASERGLPGMTPWVKHDDTATIRLIDLAVVKATLAGMRAAQSHARAQTFGGGLGRAGLRGLENLWTGAGGPGGGTAHVAAAIAEAESGGNPNAYNASGASGLWQILGQVVPGNIFNPVINAENAVKKYRDAGGFSPWVTFETGAYQQFMDKGGWLRPGWNPPMYNGTGRPEHLVPATGRAGSHTGPLVHVENMNIQDATDIELVSQRLSFSVVAAGFGS